MPYPKQPHPNLHKYLKPPSYEQVMKVVNAHGVPVQQFERFYGIYITCIKQLRRNHREIPVRYWHIIYENLQKIENNEPLPIWNPYNGITTPVAKKFKKTKKKRTAPVKKTGLIGELL